MADIYAAYVDDSEAPPGEPRINPAELKPRKEGIMAICNKIGLPCIAPRRKINVMIVGNHSAGKSSYGVRAMPPMRLLPPARCPLSLPALRMRPAVNWYIGEHVQKASVAIETQGFTFVTSGKKRDSLKGQATLQLFSHLQHDLQPFEPSIFKGLQTEVSTSKERRFAQVTLCCLLPSPSPKP